MRQKIKENSADSSNWIGEPSESMQSLATFCPCMLLGGRFAILCMSHVISLRQTKCMGTSLHSS